MAVLLRMNFQEKRLTCMEPFQWRMRVQIQMGHNFFIVTAKQVPAQMLKQLKDGGWPEEIVEEYAKIGGTPWLDHRHTVFGRVVEGMDVVLDIEGVKRNGQDRPLEDVVIESMEVNA